MANEFIVEGTYNVPLVTIGIPFFNASQFLADAIKSVRNQTYKNWELILIDDGSSDNSLLIAKSFNDPKIKLLHDGKHLGLVKRLNHIAEIANGKYLARMDADDIMHHDRIKIQIDYLTINSSCDVLGTNYYAIDGSNNIIGKGNINLQLGSRKKILAYGGFAHPTIIAKTEWVLKNRYDEGSLRFEDLELWLRTVEHSNFHNLNIPLFFYRSTGLPSLRKYAITNFGIIKMLLFKREKYSFTKFVIFKYSILYTAKIFLYFIFQTLGQLDFLIKKRYKKVSFEEKEFSTKSLSKSVM